MFPLHSFVPFLDDLVLVLDPLEHLPKGQLKPEGDRSVNVLTQYQALPPDPAAAVAAYDSELSKKFLALLRIVT